MIRNLDEIQRAPELFMALRGVIDENRQAGHKAGQFLLLSSASMDLMRQSSESLAGRIRYTEMGGFNVLEIGEQEDLRQRLWLRGGLPDSYLAADDEFPVGNDVTVISLRKFMERLQAE